MGYAYAVTQLFACHLAFRAFDDDRLLLGAYQDCREIKFAGDAVDCRRACEWLRLCVGRQLSASCHLPEDDHRNVLRLVHPPIRPYLDIDPRNRITP